jgi:hypothetical protein
VSLILRPLYAGQPQEFWGLAGGLDHSTVAVVGGQFFAAGASFSTSGAIGVSPTPGGLAFSSGATSSYVSLGRLPELGVGASLVIQFVKRDNSLRFASGTVDTGTNYIESIAVNCNDAGTVSANRLNFNFRTSATGRSASTDAILETGKVHTAVCIVTSGTSYSVFVDGREEALTYGTTGTISGSGALMDFPLVLCNQNVRNAFSNGTNVDVLFYLRTPNTLSDPLAVSANPYSLLEPRRTSIPVSVASGAYTADITPTSYTTTPATVGANIGRRAEVTPASYSATFSSIDATYTALGAFTADITPTSYAATFSNALAVTSLRGDITPASYAATFSSIDAIYTPAGAFVADITPTSYAVTFSTVDATFTPAASYFADITPVAFSTTAADVSALRAYRAEVTPASYTATFADFSAVYAPPGTGADPADVWNYVLSNGDTAEANIVEIRAMLRELYRIHGLQIGVPLVVEQTSRTAGAIIQTIEEVAGTVTVTRT